MKRKAGAQCGSAPPRPPGKRASRERQPTEMLCTAEKVSAFGAKTVCSTSRAARFHRADLAFPSRGRCRRSRRMRCSAAARLCRQMLHFASLTEILSLRYRLSVFLSRRKKNSEKERPLRGLRREVSPDLLRRTEMKSKAGAQCGSAPRDPPENGQAGRDKPTETTFTAEKVSVFGAKSALPAIHRTVFDFEPNK